MEAAPPGKGIPRSIELCFVGVGHGAIGAVPAHTFAKVEEALTGPVYLALGKQRWRR
jgi:hypothetical protein